MGNAQFANFDLIFKFAIEFGNHCHLFFMVRPSLSCAGKNIVLGLVGL